MGEVRKLQKKLRQIENLEIRVSLTPEERVKVSKKAELRSRLAELLLQLSGPQQTQCIVGEEEDKMKRQVEEAAEHHTEHQTQTPAQKIPRKDEQKKEDRTESSGQTHTIPHTPMLNSVSVPDAEFRSLRSSWEKAKFRLRVLEGHSDIITCVAAVENLVISGSRDTTVKVWHVPTATEQRNLGGHSGGVTCLCVPPAEYCRRVEDGWRESGLCVMLWLCVCLLAGQCVKSIYTFNTVTSLSFIAEGEGYIATGSGEESTHAVCLCYRNGGKSTPCVLQTFLKTKFDLLYCDYYHYHHRFI
uniref:Uncharacterized protein n=1 Tax=Astyanax mexicanus TaxID=7994 RepID=A0A8B9HHW4_ASTMX